MGRVGNSGNSSNPHLHIHLEQGGLRLVKSGGNPVKPFRRACRTRDGEPETLAELCGKPNPSHGRYGRPEVWAAIRRHDSPRGEFQDLSTTCTTPATARPGLIPQRRQELKQSRLAPAARAVRATICQRADASGHTVDADKEGYSAAFWRVHLRRTGAITGVGRQNERNDHAYGLTGQAHEAEMEAARKRNLSPSSIPYFFFFSPRRRAALHVLYAAKVGGGEIRSQLSEAGYQAG